MRPEQHLRSQGSGHGHQHASRCRRWSAPTPRSSSRRSPRTIIAGHGDDLPVSTMPADGTFPTATSQYEKRNIAVEIPVWDEELCIQCGICSFVCPHATIRMKAYDAERSRQAPRQPSSPPTAKIAEFKGMKFTVQVAPEDCTGCGACVHNCPAKNKDRPEPQGDQHDTSRRRCAPRRRTTASSSWRCPTSTRPQLKLDTLRGSQLVRPLFEFSGACAGCGETPYLKLLTQLFGDRALIANATGCSSIYGGNLPTTPYAKRADGRGPAWSNSLFEDNAEFGFGMRLAVDKFTESGPGTGGRTARLRLQLAATPSRAAHGDIKTADQSSQAGIEAQRARVAKLKEALDRLHRTPPPSSSCRWPTTWSRNRSGASAATAGPMTSATAASTTSSPPARTSTSWSSTPRSTPTPAARPPSRPRWAPWPSSPPAASRSPRRTWAMIAMAYGNVYVASVSLANPAQVRQGHSWRPRPIDGPSLIIAYSHCIAHGIDMTTGVDEQKKAVASGYWPLYRYNPALAARRQEPAAAGQQGADHRLRRVRQRREPLPRAEEDQPQRARRADEEGRALGQGSLQLLPETGGAELRGNRIIR